MAALDTVAGYLSEARILLQDTIAPYRYPDVDLIAALNIGLQEAFRLRSDLFLSALDFTVPTVATGSDQVPIELGFRQAFVYYMVGRAQLRDQEDTTDQRAGALLQKFTQQMLLVAS